MLQTEKMCVITLYKNTNNNVKMCGSNTVHL